MDTSSRNKKIPRNVAITEKIAPLWKTQSVFVPYFFIEPKAKMIGIWICTWETHFVSSIIMHPSRNKRLQCNFGLLETTWFHYGTYTVSIWSHKLSLNKRLDDLLLRFYHNCGKPLSFSNCIYIEESNVKVLLRTEDFLVMMKIEKQYKKYCRNDHSHSNFYVHDW